MYAMSMDVRARKSGQIAKQTMATSPAPAAPGLSAKTTSIRSILDTLRLCCVLERSSETSGARRQPAEPCGTFDFAAAQSDVGEQSLIEGHQQPHVAANTTFGPNPVERLLDRIHTDCPPAIGAGPLRRILN